MRRQAGHCELNSSIALLQERFRNLQKLREMREGREHQLLPAVTTTTAAGAAAAAAAATPAAAAEASSSSSSSSSSGEVMQPRWFSHPELVRPTRPVHRASAAAVAEAGMQPPPASVGGGRAAAQSSGCRSDVEVDTSLHL